MGDRRWGFNSPARFVRVHLPQFWLERACKGFFLLLLSPTKRSTPIARSLPTVLSNQLAYTRSSGASKMVSEWTDYPTPL